MTFKEELGFDITKVLLDSHNEKLKKLRKEFMDLLEKAYGLVPDDKKLKMADLEDAFSFYVEAVKREYYNANVTVYINGKPEKVDIRIYPGGKKASDRK